LTIGWLWRWPSGDGNRGELDRAVESARTIFREQLENWLGVIHLACWDLTQAGALLLSSAEKQTTPAAYLSPTEQGESTAHAITFL